MGKKFSTAINTLKKEVEITFYKSRGPGGQRKNKKETAVRIHHIPSGITVTATEYRYQARNRELAWHRLQKRLEKLNIKNKPRIPTTKPKGVREQILKEKKLLSEKKHLRAKFW